MPSFPPSAASSGLPPLPPSSTPTRITASSSFGMPRSPSLAFSPPSRSSANGRLSKADLHTIAPLNPAKCQRSGISPAPPLDLRQNLISLDASARSRAGKNFQPANSLKSLTMVGRSDQKLWPFFAVDFSGRPMAPFGVICTNVSQIETREGDRQAGRNIWNTSSRSGL